VFLGGVVEHCPEAGQFAIYSNRANFEACALTIVFDNPQRSLHFVADKGGVGFIARDFPKPTG
jgi:hypothetical protein